MPQKQRKFTAVRLEPIGGTRLLHGYRNDARGNMNRTDHDEQALHHEFHRHRCPFPCLTTRVSMADMSPAALPETSCPPRQRTSQTTLWLWAGHAAYLGPSLQLNAHSGSVLCLAVGIDAPFTLRADELGERTVRSALIAPRVVHQVVAHGERMLFCYFDPGSARAHHCRDRMREQGEHISLSHDAEDALIHLAADPDPLRLMDLVCGAVHEPIDPRIAAAIATLRAHPGRNLSATELAAPAHLSTSRFLHLFSAQAGTSFRRYRLWARMLHVGAAVSKGHDLTTASADAGFATPSHFSDAFHAMFGLTAAQLITADARIVVLDY